MSTEKRAGLALPERTHPATSADLEALLFVVDRPLTRREAAKLLEVDRATFDRLVAELQAALAGRGITLLIHGDELQLTSGPKQARAVLAWIGTGGSDMTAAPLETLTVIAYRQPVTKAGIEEIRGVDATTPSVCSSSAASSKRSIVWRPPGARIATQPRWSSCGSLDSLPSATFRRSKEMRHPS